MNIDNLSMSHIVQYNPIVYASEEIKKKYISGLIKYINIAGVSKRKYIKAQIVAYKTIINSYEPTENNSYLIDDFKYYILLDLLNIVVFDKKGLSPGKLKKIQFAYLNDFKTADIRVCNRILTLLKNDKIELNKLIQQNLLSDELKYLDYIQQNIKFKEEKPFKLLVTATMSAGKSTFINSLTGKNICRSQNMACTSKIHMIINKAYEDGYSYEYDHDLVMTAGSEELLIDNELNKTDMIYVGTEFNGYLEKQRIIINDSPGVNYSENIEHRDITRKLINSGKYDLLVYIMNATQLGTDDDAEHLDYVKKHVGNKPVIFIINKIDEFNPEEENIINTVNRQIKYIKAHGFENSIVCPVSSKAAYLAKKSYSVQLSRSETRELNNYIDKFNELKLINYYKNAFPDIVIKNEKDERRQLLKTCGDAYIENIILNIKNK